jgi:hypothetical protein
VVLIAADLDNDRSDGGGRQHSLDLALVIWLRRLVRQIGLGSRIWRGEWRRCLRYRDVYNHRLRRDGRRTYECGGPIAYRRVLMAQRIGHKRRDPQKNCYRAAPHDGIQPQDARPRKLCKGRNTALAHHRKASGAALIAPAFDASLSANKEAGNSRKQRGALRDLAVVVAACSRSLLTRACILTTMRGGEVDTIFGFEKEDGALQMNQGEPTQTSYSKYEPTCSEERSPHARGSTGNEHCSDGG